MVNFAYPFIVSKGEDASAARTHPRLLNLPDAKKAEREGGSLPQKND